MMNDNQLKSINGRISKNSLGQLLIELQNNSTIKYCATDFRKGYPGYEYNQFYAPYYIEFNNGEGWLLFSVASIRTDRVNNQQWNAYHLKQICNNIKRAFLVIPSDLKNNAKEWQLAVSYDKKINKGMFTAIDEVITQEDLMILIRCYSKDYSPKHFKTVYSFVHQDHNLAAEHDSTESK